MANKRKVQEVNAGSMADIAFLLLIFFLVATTMNVETGIQRVLPPISEDNAEDVKVKERNLLAVSVNRGDNIFVAGEEIRLAQLKDRAKEFFANVADSEDLPEKELENIEHLGEYPVSKGIISLQNDRGTSYEMYIKVQNELTRAINELRDDLSKERFGKNFMELPEDQRNAVSKAIPTRISEAEPRNIGGK